MENVAWFWITLSLELKLSNHYHRPKSHNTQIAKLPLIVNPKHFLQISKKFCLSHILHFRYIGMKTCFAQAFWAKLISNNFIPILEVTNSIQPKKSWNWIFLPKISFLWQKVLIFLKQSSMSFLTWAKAQLNYLWNTKFWPLLPLS